MKKLILGLAVTLISICSSAQTNCNAEFQYTLGLCPNILFFSNVGDPGSADVHYLWTFGDGTVSDDPSPEHYYSANGTYEVCLTVEWNGCTSTQCDVIVVDCHIDPPVCESYFQYTTGDCPVVHFYGATSSPPPGNADEWLWDFGDGSFGVGPNPIHTYSGNGVYVVCLTTIDATGCTSDYCDEIVIECLPPPCEAYFEYTLGDCPVIHFFGANSAGGIDGQHIWHFGDGTTSNDINPVHTYTENGWYNVCLIVITPDGCTAEYCEEIFIGCIPPLCEAFFEYTAGDCPEVQFFGYTNTLGDPVSWYWEFGDGHSSTLQNPTHTYLQNGYFTPCLVITTANGCTATFCQDIYIDCHQPCEAWFEYTLSDCPTVQFFASSTPAPVPGTNAWLWEFGDGTTGTGQNPVHTYAENGWYVVCLTVICEDGTASDYCEEIFIQCVPPPCEAWFEYTLSDCPTVQFFASSTPAPVPGTNAWLWEFGDGTTGTGQNPVHTYAENGWYVVCLTVICEDGTASDYCEEIFIQCVPPPCEAYFEYNQDDCPTIEFWAANANIPPTDPIIWTWHFGDGTTATGPNPVHTYDANGIYTVCLVLTTPEGCTDEYCEEIIIDCEPHPCHAFFDYEIDCPVAHFFVVLPPDVTPGTQYHWDFGDGHSGQGWEPVHTYEHNGVYKVCLTVICENGSVEEFCLDIIVDCIPPPCLALFAYENHCPEVEFFVALPSNGTPNSNFHWNFGDGTTGHGLNPVHTYEHNGVYEVCLTVICEDGSIEEFCDEVIIDCIPPPCLALFAYENNCPVVEFFVALPSNGTANTIYHWDFGDGHSGEGLNPVHVYEENGIYVVCLTVICEDGSLEEYCEEVIIECIPPHCQAHFQYSLEDCPTVEFFALSVTTPVDGHNFYWDFGDGSTGTGPNPQHTYCSNGTYEVCLIVITDDGCVAQHCEDITVNCIPQACNAYFEYDQSDCPVIHFYSALPGPVPNNTTQWQWIFGDGTTGYGPDPVHEYESNGTYTVCLVVTTADGCTAAHCEDIIIDCIPPSCEVFFSYEVEPCDVVHFYIALPSGDPNTFEEFIWDFGDGTIGYGLNPTHDYPANGTYTACLTMITADGCVAEYCDLIVIDCVPSCDVWFEYDNSDCPVIHFYAASEPIPGTNLNWEWYFGDGSTGHGPFVEHEYEENGIYTVCLVKICEDGIAVTYCEEIWIDCIPDDCEAYFEYDLSDCPTVQFYGVSSTDPIPAPNDLWYWDFGDGHFGYGPNPEHTYAENGIYGVCLTVACDNGTAVTYCEEIWIDCIPQCDAFFEYSRDECPSIEFYAGFNSPAGTGRWLWDFGDGSTGYGPSPVHTYTENGVFEVCLTTETIWGCTATYCEEIRINCLRTILVTDFISTVDAYPNPTTGRVVIEMEDSFEEIIYSLSGVDGNEYDRRLISDESSFEVDLNGLTNGIYFLKIEAGENSGTVKLFKY